MFLVLFSSFYDIPRMIPEVKGQGESVWQTIREHSEHNIYRINIICNVRDTFREPSYNNFWSYLGVFDYIPRTLPEVKRKGGTLFCGFSGNILWTFTGSLLKGLYTTFPEYFKNPVVIFHHILRLLPEVKRQGGTSTGRLWGNISDVQRNFRWP